MSDEMEEYWQLFAEESEDALNNSEEALVQLASKPDDTEQIATLFRAMHTFKGSSRMMGLCGIESVSHVFEDIVGLVRDEGVPLTKDIHSLLIRTLDILRDKLEQVLEARSDPGVHQEIYDELKKMYVIKSGKAPAAESEAIDLPVIPEPVQPDTSSVDAETVITDAAVETNNLSQIEPAESVIEEMPLTDNTEITESNHEQVASSSEVEVSTTTETTDIQPQATTEDTAATQANVSTKNDTSESESCKSLAEDPTYVKIFMDMAEAELEKLSEAMNQYAEQEPESVDSIKNILDTLHHAANNMGYVRIVAQAEEFLDVVNDPEKQVNKDTIGHCELKLREEIAAILNVVHIAGEEQIKDDMVHARKVSSIFLQSYAKHNDQNLLQLNQHMDGIAKEIEDLISGVNINKKSTHAAPCSKLLRNVYHACVFYDLDRASQLTLALEDLYSRINQGELVASRELVDLTRRYIGCLEEAIRAKQEGREPELAGIDILLEETRNKAFLVDENQVAIVTHQVLGLLDIPEGFYEVITPENTLDLSRSLAEEEHFYTILADIESDENIGMGFYKWSSSEGISLVTNITVYQDNKTLFQFLLTSPYPEDIIQEELRKIDSSGKYLQLRACEVRLDIPESDYFPEENILECSFIEDANPTEEPEIKIDIMEAVGQLVTAHAGLVHLTNRLTSTDLSEIVNKQVQLAGNDLYRARNLITRALEAWNEEITNQLSQVCNEFAANLEQFRETALLLQDKPVTPLIENLQKVIQETAHHHDKKVKLEFKGNDILLDYKLQAIFQEPLQRLAWLIVTHSLEDRQARLEASKPVSNKMTVEFSKHDDHARISVTDDGAGFNDDIITNELPRITDPLGAKNGKLVHESSENLNEYNLILPLTSMVIDGMVVRVGSIRYVIPIKAIRRIVTSDPNQFTVCSNKNNEKVFRMEDELILLRDLSSGRSAEIEKLIEKKLADKRTPTPENIHENNLHEINKQTLPKQSDATTAQEPTGNNNKTIETDTLQMLVVVEKEHSTLAFPIDELIGQQQVLVHPLQGYLSDIPGMSGCALLGSGEVGMVLDVNND
ncbi:MAG: hypothetical protein Tsb005_18630 [Gammaproteobacteria bacterium]